MSAPRTRSRTLALAFALAASGCGGATAPPAAPPSPDDPVSRAATGGSGPTPASLDSRPIDPALAVLTFDSAWSRVHTSYYDPDFREIDWVGVRDELRPLAERATSRGELRAVLGEMLDRLGESHFAILHEEDLHDLAPDLPEEAGGEGGGEVPIDLRWVDGELTVTAVHGDPAAVAPLAPGWQLLGVGERSLAEWGAAIAAAEAGAVRTGLQVQTVASARALLAGPVGSQVRLRLRDGEGAERALTAVRRPVRGEIVQFGALPPMPAYLEGERVERGGECVGRIAFNIWMIPLIDDFHRAVDAAADCRGVVIDLRGNPGGIGGMVMSTAGSFFGEQVPLGVLTSRSGEIRFVAMPRRVDSEGELRDPFTGALAVLVDEMSMSTSEVFAAGLKSSGRARVFGSTTPGYALPAMTLPLPSGDVLYHVVANLTDPEGVRIEGRGVEPDVELPLRRADLLAGRDRALEAAVDWAFSAQGPTLRSQPHPSY